LAPKNLKVNKVHKLIPNLDNKKKCLSLQKFKAIRTTWFKYY